MAKGENDTPTKGRPTDYSKTYPKQAAKLCELGATDVEIADFFDVDVRTIYRWKITHKEFCQALTRGKDKADERVERSLYQRAVGYDYPSVKIFMPAGAPKPVYADFKEHIPADVGAAKSWLMNRRPDEWREKQSHEHSGPNGGPIETRTEIGTLTDAELEAIATGGGGTAKKAQSSD